MFLLFFFSSVVAVYYTVLFSITFQSYDKCTFSPLGILIVVIALRKFTKWPYLIMEEPYARKRMHLCFVVSCIYGLWLLQGANTTTNITQRAAGGITLCIHTTNLALCSVCVFMCVSQTRPQKQ